MTATTTAIPSGYYAIPIHDSDEYDPDDPRYCEHVGYHLVTVTKKGRIRRSARALDGIDHDRFIATLDYERDMFGDPPSYMLGTHEDREYYRAEYGKLTGHCGSCGRKLTDPESLAWGIGPDCRAGLLDRATADRAGHMNGRPSTGATSTGPA